jgi:hypothetical protein
MFVMAGQVPAIHDHVASDGAACRATLGTCTCCIDARLRPGKSRAKARDGWSVFMDGRHLAGHDDFGFG